MINCDSSDEDLIPLNKSPHNDEDRHVISLFSETLLRSANLHSKVLETILGKFISQKAIRQIEARIEQLDQFGLRDDEIANIIAEDEIPPNPLKHAQVAHSRAELGEIAFRHLLKKHGLEGLAKKKEEEIEQLLLENKSFEMIQKIITE